MTTTTSPSPSVPTHNPFAGVTTLGKLLSYHEQQVQGFGGRRKVANFTLIFGIALLVFGGILMLQENGNAMCLVLPGAGLIGLGLLGFWDANSSKDMKVAIFEEGIAVSEKQTIKTLRWEEVAHAFQILTRQGNTDIIRHGYRLESAKGQTVWWNDDVRQAAQAWEAVRRQVYPRLMHAISATFNRGEPVTFGEFSAHRDGLTHGKKAMLWTGIQEVTVANGILVIKGDINGKKEEFRTMWATVPNADLLLNLMEQMRPTA